MAEMTTPPYPLSLRDPKCVEHLGPDDVDRVYTFLRRHGYESSLGAWYCKMRGIKLD